VDGEEETSIFVKDASEGNITFSIFSNLALILILSGERISGH